MSALSLQSKLPHVGTTIFSTMTQLALQHNAINLAQGFPDFGCPEELLELVTQAMHQGHNQYAPSTGLLALRQKISEKTQLMYGHLPHQDHEVTVTSGATEALFAAIAAVVQPGDEVLVVEPCYDSYVPAIELCGGVPVYASLTYPDFSIDWQQIEDKLTPKTRLLLLNSPHNPTGAVWQQQDLDALQRLAEKHSFLILSDEVYEHMVFDGKPHLSILSVPALAERAFVISSFGKTYHTTGWKVGYCIAPPALTAEFRKVHQYLTFSTATPFQHGLAGFLDNQKHYQQLPAFYQQKRDLFAQLLQPSKFELIPCAGTYFQLARYTAISDLPDVEFAQWLTKEAGVATIPISVFYHDQTDHRVVRFCFAKKEETLRAAAERLCRL
ncbi:aminotransferase class I/II-fold pyridoxal phosphate-dependent enzyme [Nibribacter ruber]|uniref:Aminotransferase class I/II-fold pyridoxal phosphate-dependent enzyme n=1 Tax=Nibribacter ruber TaxID=2698458 RepID=A0A6P1P2I4_9BACT|nr:pyridoxal phosphate-dependent aminotransferase [Nibribacter ruber]QHL88582.1 aminotransferase class I/II-fold pyridoxal phosphate-dependent enzyme [Nibribacter ruber]